MISSPGREELFLPPMNDRSARLGAQFRARAGYTGNLAGSHPGGTDDEAACQVLRPCAQYHDRRAIY